MSRNTETNPFVGLRPFESDESLLFFGRKEQIGELMQRLHAHHFVGVVGSSGSGKSSLIKAGLIPRLKAGYLVGERDRWILSISKPGESPVYNFISNLAQALDLNLSAAALEKLVIKVKEEGTSAVLELLKTPLSNNRTNIFILVDQFEELFRFSMETNDDKKHDEAIEFVNILLALSKRHDLPIYVVITLRSDFVGECSLFFGLPEALNSSQYLVPRLTRVQLTHAIEGPIRLYGGKINPALTARLINEVERLKDELPLLQHVLMRTWDYEMKTDNNGELDIHDYEAIGGIENALSIHANEALEGMSELEKKQSEIMFQALTTTDHNGRKIRRPAHLGEIVKLTGSNADAIQKLINHFNNDKRSFLVVNKGANTSDPLVDISHESLIRQWETLSKWADDENNSAKTYLHISESATLNKEGKKDLLGGAELEVALQWLNLRKPDAVWAGRYNDNFKETLDFLNKSIKQAEIDKEQKEEARKTALLAKEQKKLLKRTTGLLIVVGIFLIAAIISTINFYNQKKLAFAEELKAKKALEINTRALDSLYVAAARVEQMCWDEFIPVEIVLREGNPNYVRLEDRIKNGKNNPGLAQQGNPNGTNADNETTTGPPNGIPDANNGKPNKPGSSPSQAGSPSSPTGSTSPGAPFSSNAPNGGPSTSSVSDDNNPHLSVDVRPEFPGGSKAMKRFIMDNLEYPDAAYEKKISGVVNLKFIVSATGKIQEIEFIGTRIGYGLEEAAMAVMKKMPNWKPAVRDGKNVPYYYTLPISFIPPANE